MPRVLKGLLPSRRDRFDVTFYSPWLGPLLIRGAKPAGGGAETQLSVIARTLARRGYRVCFVVYGDPRQLPRLLAELALQADVIVSQIGESDVEVDLLGSYDVQEMQAELARRLEAAMPGEDITVGG